MSTPSKQKRRRRFPSALAGKEVALCVCRGRSASSVGNDACGGQIPARLRGCQRGAAGGYRGPRSPRERRRAGRRQSRDWTARHWRCEIQNGIWIVPAHGDFVPRRSASIFAMPSVSRVRSPEAGAAILIAAPSGRALAAAARRAGYRPLVADFFDDLDTRGFCAANRLIEGGLDTGFEAREPHRHA